MIKARSHSEWPSRGLSTATPGLNRLACSGIRGQDGAEHAIEHVKPHSGYVHDNTCWRVGCTGFLGQWRRWSICVGFCPPWIFDIHGPSLDESATLSSGRPCLCVFFARPHSRASILERHLKFTHGPADPLLIVEVLKDPCMRLQSSVCTQAGETYSDVLGGLRPDDLRSARSLPGEQQPLTGFGSPAQSPGARCPPGAAGAARASILRALVVHDCHQ